MVDSKALLHAALDASVVPIRALSVRHRPAIARHLKSLDAHDRYYRFGYAANDAHIQRYVEGLDFERDEIFGIYNRKLQIIAVAHLAFTSEPECQSCAEFGVSVLADARGKHLGTRLFDRAIMHARTEGVNLMFIHALSENAAMLKIATNAGAEVEREGAESDAYLRLPPATLDTHLSDAVEDGLGEFDFKLKVQAKRFREFLGVVQEMRANVHERHHNATD